MSTTWRKNRYYSQRMSLCHGAKEKNIGNSESERMRHLNGLWEIERILKLHYDKREQMISRSFTHSRALSLALCENVSAFRLWRTSICTWGNVSASVRVKHRYTFVVHPKYEKRIQINYCQLSDQNVSACKTPTNRFGWANDRTSEREKIGAFCAQFEIGRFSVALSLSCMLCSD